ncbi:MAG: hypothetical protein WC592_03400 [Candidatus Omnitrophota bacterium]|nr:hypothetical protein [Candidatus Omnitrophota bacterium]
MKKNIIVIACIAMAACFVMVSASFAAEKSAGTPIQAKNVKDFSAKAAKYPVNVVKKTAENVAKTTKRGANIVVDAGRKSMDIVSNEAKALGAMPKDPGKIKDVTIEPVKGTTLMVGETANDTAVMTGEAAKDVVTLPVDAAKQ